jgi:hypothetical protein
MEARNQLLLENIVSIMHSIENKKAENKKKHRICYDIYPLNPLNASFQTHMKMKDYSQL